MPELYVCPYCGLSYPTLEILQGHIAVEHPPAPPPEPEPEPEPGLIYTCPQCGAAFATQAELDAHKAAAHPPAPPPEPPPEPEPPPYVALPWFGNIYSFFWDVSQWFYSAYIETSSWWVVGPLFSAICLGLANLFSAVLSPIAAFWFWAEDIATKIVAVWTADGILGLLKWWFPWLYDIGEWFYYRWQWFSTLVGDWWDSTKTTVLGWIDIAVEGLNSLIVWWDEFWKITWPRWMATLEVLGDEVSNFFTKTLPDLLNYLKLEYWWNGKLWDVDGLIGSKLAEWFPFYDDIVEFISDPGEFLLSKLTDWFLGKEE